MPCDESLPIKLICVVSKFSCAKLLGAVEFREDPLHGTFPARSDIGSDSEQRIAWQPDVTAAAGRSAVRVSLFAAGQ
jgi:hypothetical protein